MSSTSTSTTNFINRPQVRTKPIDMNNTKLDATKLAMDVIRDNFPVFFKKNMWHVVSVCMDNEDWCDRLVDKGEDDLLFLADVLHDVKGLTHRALSSDEHFLPRI
jgi:hypothetical protein